jgi:glycine hydroxymethyltransferase
MALSHGGHLSHGHRLSLSGRFYQFMPFGVDRISERIDYGAVAELARSAKPRMIVVGGSAYSRRLDFARFREICDEVGALLLVDQAHIGGLVAAGLHPSPVAHADFVTGTTYKTLGGAKGGYVLCRATHAQAIDRAVFPGVQGSFGPHTIAAKAVTFQMAMTPEFRAIQQRIVGNARRLAERLQAASWRIVAGGTDTHLFLVDVASRGLTGEQAEGALEAVGICVNRNLIPYDPQPPLVASGIRIGTPAVTFRGFDLDEIDKLVGILVAVLEHPADEVVRGRAREQVRALCARFPIYGLAG